MNSHPLLVALLAAAAWWWQHRAAKQKNAERPPAAEEDERTRRVREEVQRRIAERRAGGRPPLDASPPSSRPLAPPELAPRPVARDLGGLGKYFERPVTDPEPLQETEAAALETEEEQKTFAAQQRMAAQIRALEAAQAANAARAARIAALVAATPGEPKAAAWLTDLRGADGLKRAMILREVLGPPVGAR